MPRRIVADSAVKVCARVGMDPVSVDLPETEVLRGQSVPWIFPVLPFPIRRFLRLILEKWYSLIHPKLV